MHCEVKRGFRSGIYPNIEGGVELVRRELLERFAGVEALLALFSEADSRIASLSADTGLRCLTGCGSCCETPNLNIEAMPFELYPLALHAHTSGAAGRLLETAMAAPHDAHCVLYSRDALLSTPGGCTSYALRPLICRLFGFVAALDKHGSPRLSVCRKIKQSSPAMAAVSGAVVRAGLDAPVFSHFALRAAGLAPLSASERMPINRAVRAAMEQTGYRLSLMGL